jgi:predicted secreted Zn-dependent protease
MRPWFIVALLCAALTLGCNSLVAQPASVQPPRSLPLETILANTYDNEYVRVIEHVWLKPYAVPSDGGLPGIRKELDRLGPESEVLGRRFDGLTTWGLHWSFSFDTSPGACSIRNANVEVEAVVTLPELDDEARLSSEDAALWEGYALRLRMHEDGHVNIYRAGAQELSNEIVALGEMPSCEELRQTLTSLGEAKIQRISQADRNYDLETGHGAIFPTKK